MPRYSSVAMRRRGSKSLLGRNAGSITEMMRISKVHQHEFMCYSTATFEDCQTFVFSSQCIPDARSPYLHAHSILPESARKRLRKEALICEEYQGMIRALRVEISCKSRSLARSNIRLRHLTTTQTRSLTDCGENPLGS